MAILATPKIKLRDLGLFRVVCPAEKRTETILNVNKFILTLFVCLMSLTTYLAGLSSLWEFELRILANKLGVYIYKTYEETSVKGRKAKFVEFNDHEDVIRDLNRKTNNILNLDLDTIRQVRNGLVSFNFNHT